MTFVMIHLAVAAPANPGAGAIFPLSAFRAWALDTSPDAGLIAIVDDDKLVLKSLERLVKSAGFSVQTFRSAEEFLESGRDSRTACLILDIELPGMSGLDLQMRLAAKNPQIRIVFVSAHDETENRARAMSEGAFAFLSKPIDGEALLNAVSSALK
jgi:FixJ family two-component response regulator